jgi:hypothetical protein
MNFLRGLGIAIVSLVVVLASLLFICFSACAVGAGPFGGGDRITWIIAALIDLGVIVAGVYAIKRLHRHTAR